MKDQNELESIKRSITLDASSLSSLITLGMGILISIYILDFTNWLDTSSLNSIVRSIVLVWGMIYLINSVCALILAILSHISWVYLHYDLLMRVIFVITIPLVTGIHFDGVGVVGGVIGIFFCFASYVYLGRWFFHPLDAIGYYRYQQLEFNKLVEESDSPS